MLKIRIETRNSAFEEDLENEIACCLEEVIKDILANRKEAIIFDGNGNKIGNFTLTNR